MSYIAAYLLRSSMSMTSFTGSLPSSSATVSFVSARNTLTGGWHVIACRGKLRKSPQSPHALPYPNKHEGKSIRCY